MAKVISPNVWLVRKSDGYAFRKQGMQHYNKGDFDEVHSETNPMLAAEAAPSDPDFNDNDLNANDLNANDDE